MKKKSVKTRKLTKCLSLLLSVIMLCAMIPMTSLTAHAEVYSGTEGKAQWNLDTETGVLTVTGAGDMNNYGGGVAGFPGYYQYREYTKFIEIKKYVTKLGNYAFYIHKEAVSVSIPDSVRTIGEFTFYGCRSLYNITIPSSVTSIGTRAFFACNNLSWICIKNPNCTIGDNAIPSSVHICCSTGSKAEEYAKKNGNSYGHSGEWEIIDEPTCTEDGKRRLKLVCTTCLELSEEAIPALGHDKEELGRDEPTCTEDGAIYYKCKRCNENIVEPIPALGHVFGGWSETADGEQHAQTCSRCHVIEAEDHSYGDWTTTDAPSCTEEGEKSHTCTVCGHVETCAIPALGHNFGACTAIDDYQHQHTCSRCNLVEAEDHDYQIEEVAKDATLTAEGRAYTACSLCGESSLITLPKLSEEDYDLSGTTTCTEAGTLTYTWKDKTYGTYSVSVGESPALGHHYVETDLPDGRTEHKCSRCGDVYYTGEATVTKLIGDADGDGEITIYDVTRIQRVLASLETDADIVATARDRGRTGSEALSIFDATNIQRYVAHYQDGNDIGKPRA